MSAEPVSQTRTPSPHPSPAPGQQPPPAVVAAYRYCVTVAGQHARNFSYGARLMPGPRRDALSALYAFARRVDDAGDDGTLHPGAKEQRLADARALVARVRAGEVAEDDIDPVAVALADAARRHPVPLDALDELIDGVLMDVRGEHYETWDDLRLYCHRVAGTIGRLSLGVFGVRPGARQADRAPDYADTLGLALQVTNILRDIREDAQGGRVYLPAEDLRKFGCPEDPDGLQAPPRGADFAGLVRFEARRARELFAEGYLLLPMLDRRSAACVAAMAGIYHRLLDRIEAEPAAVLRGRVALPAASKAAVALRALTGVDARRVARGRWT